jgi:hypothetical protein
MGEFCSLNPVSLNPWGLQCHTHAHAPAVRRFPAHSNAAMALLADSTLACDSSANSSVKASVSNARAPWRGRMRMCMRTMEVHADASLTDVAEQRIKGVREREQLRAEVEAGVRSEVEAEYRAEMGRLRYLPSPAYLQTPQSRR